MGKLLSLFGWVGVIGLASVAPAAAEDAGPGAESGIALSGSVALVSDYRARGLTVSDNQAALQGGLDLAGTSGWAVGVWGSSLDPNADEPDLELDVYASHTVAVGSTEFGVGLTWYHYPNTDDLDYGEAALTVARAFGAADVSAGVSYAWEQAAVGETDNTYVFATASAPLAMIGPLPISASGGLGYEEGGFAVEESKLDWSVGLAAGFGSWALSASYVGSDIADPIGDDGFVVALETGF